MPRWVEGHYRMIKKNGRWKKVWVNGHYRTIPVIRRYTLRSR